MCAVENYIQHLIRVSFDKVCLSLCCCFVAEKQRLRFCELEDSLDTVLVYSRYSVDIAINFIIPNTECV
jgi:hypothetical protein